MSIDDRGPGSVSGTGGALDVERDSDVPISTQIYWQLAYQIDPVGCCLVLACRPCASLVRH